MLPGIKSGWRLIESAEQMCYTSYAKYDSQREGG